MVDIAVMRHRLARRSALAVVSLCALAIIGCARSRVIVVDDAALKAADADAANWITYGHTYSEQRFSSLKQVNEQTVSRLGLAWSFDLETLRGLEATPLVKDGVLYTTSAWSLLYAFDARTGHLLWQYDPHVPKDHAKFVCCDVVNRGVELYRGREYVGTLDGRLIALDAKTGAVVWDVQTTPQDRPPPHTPPPPAAPRGGGILCRRRSGVGCPNYAEGRPLRHHRRASRCQGARVYWKRRVGVCGAWLRLGIRRGDRQADLEELHRARRPVKAVRVRSDATGGR